ncbi:MAG: AAA family ATPase, partial [Bacteroidetes bacterium]|nr:AAA family ATPase [Bacteroidota bacterium]
LQAKPDRQICLSFGLVSGKIGEEEYRNFLFHIPLTINLKKQIISLQADTIAHVITCEQAFTELIDQHFPGESEEKLRERKLKVLREVDQFNSQSREFNFAMDYLRGTFYETAIRILEIFPEIHDQFFHGNDLNYELPEFNGNGPITFSFSPVIHLRELASGVHVAHDADKIISKINELGSQGQNELIPDFFKKLFSLRKPGNPLRIAYRVENKSVKSPSVTQDMDETFLFPLPYNQEQLSIAKQLSKQDAVTVQGPPGTGKSHTIANLASHFVAHGKSILIVSKNAKALEVIKGKLPPAIQNLAVALLEGTQNQEELKHSIDAIKNHLNRHYDPEEVIRLEEELAQLEEEADQIREEVLAQIEANQTEFSLYHPEKKKILKGNAAFWAKLWEESPKEFKILRDEVSVCSCTPSHKHRPLKKGLSPDQGLRLKDTLPAVDVSSSQGAWPAGTHLLRGCGLCEGVLRGDDEVSAEQETEVWVNQLVELSNQAAKTRSDLPELDLPEISDLPSMEDGQKILDQIEKLSASVSTADYIGILPHHIDEAFLGRISIIKNLLKELAPYQKIFQHPRFNREDIAHIWEEYRELKEKIETVNREMLSEKVDLGELAEEDPDYLLEELLSLKSKYNDEGKLGLFKRKILPKAQKSLLEVRINGRTIRGPQDLGVLQGKLQQTAWIKQLTIVMDNYLSQLGIPGEWDDALVVYREWEDVINALTQIEKFRSEVKSRNLKPLENTEAYWNYLEG